MAIWIYAISPYGTCGVIGRYLAYIFVKDSYALAPDVASTLALGPLALGPPALGAPVPGIVGVLPPTRC